MSPYQAEATKRRAKKEEKEREVQRLSIHDSEQQAEELLKDKLRIRVFIVVAALKKISCACIFICDILIFNFILIVGRKSVAEKRVNNVGEGIILNLKDFGTTQKYVIII